MTTELRVTFTKHETKYWKPRGKRKKTVSTKEEEWNKINCKQKSVHQKTNSVEII